MRKLLLAGAVVLAGAMFGTSNADAAAIFIDDTTDPNIVIRWADFDFGGFSVNGSAPTTSGSATVVEGTPINFSGSWVFNPPLQGAGSFNYVLTEPGGVISDVLSYTIAETSFAVATIRGSFCSDSATLPCTVPATGTTITAPETGAPVSFSATNLTGSFQSDPPRAVSEPASLGLFGLGLLGLYGFARRREGRRGHLRMA